MDHPPAWEQVVAAAADLEVVPGTRPTVAERLKPYLDEPAGRARRRARAARPRPAGTTQKLREQADWLLLDVTTPLPSLGGRPRRRSVLPIRVQQVTLRSPEPLDLATGRI